MPLVALGKKLRCGKPRTLGQSVCRHRSYGSIDGHGFRRRAVLKRLKGAVWLMAYSFRRDLDFCHSHLDARGPTSIKQGDSTSSRWTHSKQWVKSVRLGGPPFSFLRAYSKPKLDNNSIRNQVQRVQIPHTARSFLQGGVPPSSEGRGL